MLSEPRTFAACDPAAYIWSVKAARYMIHAPAMQAAVIGAGKTFAGRSRMPPQCRDMPFLIRRDGVWLYRGSPIERKEMVCLFAGVLTRDEDGAFLLETPVERGRIEVEDAPFVAVELDWRLCRDGGQYLSFRLNTDQLVCAGPAHGLRMQPGPGEDERIPYLHVRDGQGRFAVEARICRAVYYELVALAVPRTIDGRRMLGVWSGGVFFPLGPLPGCGTAEDEPIGQA